MIFLPGLIFPDSCGNEPDADLHGHLANAAAAMQAWLPCLQ
jgi:hypothetical protein